MRSALIIGGDSAIGSRLASHVRAQGIRVHVTSRRGDAQGAIPLDLEQLPQRWADVPQADVAFLCAAITRLDLCEANPDATRRVNVVHMQSLTEKLLAQNTYVVFLSSNQVFDGAQAYPHTLSPTCPVNAYGEQKAAFEAWLLSQPAAVSVLRLTKTIAQALPVLETWKQALAENKTIEAFTNLVFAPLPVAGALAGLYYLGAHKPRGIFQLSGLRDISYFDVACALALNLGAAPSKVIAADARNAGIKPQFLPQHATLQPSEIFAGIISPEPLEVVGITV